MNFPVGRWDCMNPNRVHNWIRLNKEIVSILMTLCHSLLQSLCSLLVPQGTYYSWTTWATWRETLPNTYYITSFKHILFKRKGLVVALNGTLNSSLSLDHTSFHASPIAISSCSYLGKTMQALIKLHLIRGEDSWFWSNSFLLLLLLFFVHFFLFLTISRKLKQFFS